MTFYDQIADIIKNSLEELDLKVSIFNDASKYLLKKPSMEDGELVLILKTGQGTTSKSKDFLMTSYPLYLTGFVTQNNAQDTLEKLNTYVNSCNGNVLTLDDGTYYQLGFEEPMVTNVDQSIQLKSEEVKVNVIALTGTALLSEEDIEMPEFKLGGYTIERVQSYTDSCTCDYSTIQEKNESLSDASFNSSTRVWQITFIKKRNSSFQSFIENYYITYPKPKVAFVKDNTNYTVVIQSISEALSQTIGVPVIVINLMEVRS